MRAMVLSRPGQPLELRDLPARDPGPGEIRLRVAACGVCRTDLHVVDGELPWLERPVVPVRSVANLTRSDGEELLALAPAVPLHAEVVRYPLAQANQALADLRRGRLRGAAVLIP
jgi:D-arabinose 1-dehydrogenase-like Zn-dependent alcohol dehydrogenase